MIPFPLEHSEIPKLSVTIRIFDRILKGLPVIPATP